MNEHTFANCTHEYTSAAGIKFMAMTMPFDALGKWCFPGDKMVYEDDTCIVNDYEPLYMALVPETVRTYYNPRRVFTVAGICAYDAGDDGSQLGVIDNHGNFYFADECYHV